MPKGFSFWLQMISLAVAVLLLSVHPWDWRVGLASGLGLLVVAGGWMRTQIRRLERQHRERAAREQLELLSLQRHDWLNHLQVLLGFTTLNKAERIAPYLQELVKRLDIERVSSQVEPPELALKLALLNRDHPEWHWVVEVGEELGPLKGNAADRIGWILEQTATWLKPFAGEAGEVKELYLQLSGYQGGFLLQFRPEGEEKYPTGEWQQLREKIKACGGEAMLRDSGRFFDIRVPSERNT
ncbi:Spo0B domain-containing protein [Kroppenstedtia eburnea]|uniref:Sensor_kinase_SpoOB-type, alpha-helical domain n=1 Tax=Kroppenstedtia eburnea TaxID=714067 RepID=A0A1N7M4D3_9BACL|nr:Spo0B domain-containing protein [Kroppenstedtia eburnea]QKI81818.1 hypothetical protein GXN75_07295 [Kroppenstedtia eburnea]SIS80839.1 Sensor_kinase_SpoOB-type, alpha-helical domain [Kroppenstedtia eburnea]